MQWVHKLYNYILNVSITCFYVVHFKKKDWKEGLILCRKYLQREEGRGNKWIQTERQNVEREGEKKKSGQKESLTLPPCAEPLTLHENNKISLLNKPDPDPSHLPLLVTYFPRGLATDGGETVAPNTGLSSLAS